jgi:ADP-dependent NAD(P)H-hydrate dehydratase / NAD(P)H-hydrate epimerase
MIVSCEEMRGLEEKAFASGSSAEELMEKAGDQIAHAVRQFFPLPGNAEIYYGKGHNGGDALVAARHLAGAGWAITLRAQELDEQKLSDLTRKKLFELTSAYSGPGEPHRHPRVILDGLLGIGAKGPLRDAIREITREINARRHRINAHVFAIDLPTGLDGDTGDADDDCVTADFTLTIGFAKRGLVADQAADHVGRLAVLSLPQLNQADSDIGARCERDAVATAASLAALLPRRKTETHKTQYGRIGVVAGSVGFTGAALLAAYGALHAGAGLVSLYAPDDIQPTLAAAASPEIMVKPVKSYCDLLDSKRDVIAIGPGLGHERAEDVLDLIGRCDEPMVLDADALNILANGNASADAASRRDGAHV